jgi:dTDP-4-amino-4,6-dideoxygalactose transaminase
MTSLFSKSFTQQEPIPPEAIARAIEVMNSGRIHRYNVAKDEISETSLLEQEFASYIGVKYCLAVSSGGYALTTALRALLIKADQPVLTNAFTLAPVPGSIAGAGGKPIFVDVTSNLLIDFDDLERKAIESRAKILMLSHMRGHIADMDLLMDLCAKHQLTVIEDCAHTLGAEWNGIKSGRHGLIGCYSTQTYKHMNSGEGGFIVSDDAEVMARATIFSGSYMLYGNHIASPPKEVFENIRLETPNCSGRMDNLRAAILRPQLQHLDQNCQRWNDRYNTVAAEISDVPSIRLPYRSNSEKYVGSSIQFNLPHWSNDDIKKFLMLTYSRGVELKWFGADEPIGFTSTYKTWTYAENQYLPKSDEVLRTLCDMRLPLTFTIEDCALIGQVIRECALSVQADR